MTCIAAVIHRGRVHMGGDSCVSTGRVKTLSTPKVWRAGCFVIGICGMVDYEVALRHRLRWPDDVDELEDGAAGLERYMLVTFPDELRDALRKAGIEETAESSGALIGVAGTLWAIDGTTPLPIVERYAATGSGWEVALGALSSAAGGWGGHRRVRNALEAAAQHRTDVCAPFHYVST